MKSYDLAIIGSGPGGYIAGLYASRLKLSTCVIEKDLTGGTCLNRGCIPTKSLINSASIINVIKGASSSGIAVEGLRVDFSKMASHKDQVVSRLRTGIETLFRANKIDLIKGEASFAGANTIIVNGSDTINAKYIIVATGSRPSTLSNMPADEKNVLSSDGILTMTDIPGSILIIGGGVIGCEFASLYNSLGSKVTVVEFMDRLVPSQSREVSRKLERDFKKAGIDIFLSAKAEKIDKAGSLKVRLSGGKDVEAGKILVSVGRTASIEGIGLDKAGIKIERGRIAVDDFLRTSAPNIYAIGDCIEGPLLAHKASYDGILACDNIVGNKRRRDYSNIPNLIWTNPEIASVGMNEEEARSRLPDIKIAKFPYLASGKAYLKGATDGFVKIMGDAKGTIEGVEIYGADACELIAEAVLARSAGIKIGEWAHVVHGHPTLSEMLQEACHIFCGTPIHGI